MSLTTALRLGRAIRPVACARGGPSRLALHDFRRHESSSAALKRAEAARKQAASEPTFFRNDAIPYSVVRFVNPKTNKLEPETELTDLLATVDLEKNYVQLISTGGPDGSKPIVKIINKREAVKKERDQKSKKKEQKKGAVGRETKEIQLSFTVEPGDLKHKLEKCITELEKKNRVVAIFVKKKSAPVPSPEQKAARLQAVWEAVQHVATESQPRSIQDATAALYLQGTGKAEDTEAQYGVLGGISWVCCRVRPCRSIYIKGSYGIVRNLTAPNMRQYLLALSLALVGAFAAPLASNATRYDSIVPGANWLDTDGVLIQAHGGCMVRTTDGTFYWFGEDHRPGGTLFTGIAVYSSKDLYNWKNEGLALKPVAGTQAASDQVGERPKVVWSESTNQWILYFHSDNPSYSLHLQGTGVSPNITGPYNYQGSYLPLGAASQDLGMYVDDDGQAYALYGSGGNNLITRLNSARTNESETIYRFSGTNLEAPGMFKQGSTYYHIFSQKTGYRPNDAQLYTASALTGPWTKQAQLAPAGTHTWESQNTFEFKIGSTAIFMGDRWDRDELSDSRYMWLPITVGSDGKSASLPWHDVWKIDVNTGAVTYPTGTSYEAEKGSLAGGAAITACSTCSGGNYVTNITSSSSVTMPNIVGTGVPQWLAMYYVNTDVQTTALHRYASVSVNGGTAQVVKQRTTDVGVVVSVPLQVTFTKGSTNKVTISGVSGRPESAWLDRIIVY